MIIKFSNILGISLLLAAAFIIVNQFDNYMNISIGSIIAAVLSLIFIVHCIAHLRFAFLPVPLAVLYIIFQTPLALPDMQPKYLILASLLASIGLVIMLPGKKWKNHNKFKCYSKYNNQQQMFTENTNKNNNQSIKVNFGAKSRSLCADNLETIELYCNFGAMEIFFDQAVISPKGATVNINCSFGAIQLIIPKHWKVIEQINCSLGGVEVDKYFAANPAENAPQLTIAGSVSLGGIEIKSL